MENLSYLSPEDRERHKATAQVTLREGCASFVKGAVVPYTALQPGMRLWTDHFNSGHCSFPDRFHVPEAAWDGRCGEGGSSQGEPDFCAL